MNNNSNVNIFPRDIIPQMRRLNKSLLPKIKKALEDKTLPIRDALIYPANIIDSYPEAWVKPTNAMLTNLIQVLDKHKLKIVKLGLEGGYIIMEISKK